MTFTMPSDSQITIDIESHDEMDYYWSNRWRDDEYYALTFEPQKRELRVDPVRYNALRQGNMNNLYYQHPLPDRIDSRKLADWIEEQEELLEALGEIASAHEVEIEHSDKKGRLPSDYNPEQVLNLRHAPTVEVVDPVDPLSEQFSYRVDHDDLLEMSEEEIRETVEEIAQELEEGGLTPRPGCGDFTQSNTVDYVVEEMLLRRQDEIHRRRQE